MTQFPDLLDVLIIGAGPCGLAAAARLHEETPSAMFTDEEHQRYHWINKHSGRMALVQARHREIKGVRAEKLNNAAAGNRNPNSRDIGNKNAKNRNGSLSSTTATDDNDTPPSLSTSPQTISSFSSVDTDDEYGDGAGSDSDSNSEKKGLSMKVLDSTGPQWMEKWNRAFRTLEIEQLRSPMFFHVDPGDRDGMLAYTQETGREKDLWEISGCVGKELSKHQKKKKQAKSKQTIGGVEIDERDRKDYFSPSTGLFADYCSSIINRYGLNRPGTILHREVADIQYSLHPDFPIPSNDPEKESKIFTVTTTTGEKFYTRAVVLAIGPGRTKIFPFQPNEDEKSGCCHSTEIKEFPSPNVQRKIRQRRETNVVVVGGGLSSAQIVDMAVRKGVSKVWFLMRSEFKVKHFDIGLSWMGKFKNYEKAAFWSADTDEERLEKIKTARNGGSITPRYQKILKHHASRSRVSTHTRTTILSHTYCPQTNTWSLTTDPPIPDLPPIDYIYFATGMGMDVTELPMLQHMHADYPIECKQGLPCITDDLMWCSNLPLFVTGRLGALRLGPGAANLEGARLGAERVAWGMEEMFGKDEGEGDEEGGLGMKDEGGVKKLRECFCGLGNRYAGLEMDC